MGWVAILAGIVSSLVAAELYLWLPALAERLIRHHVKKLPPEISSRMLEEWRGVLADVPGNLAKFLFALDLFRATPRIIHEFYLPNAPYRPLTDLTLRARDVLLAGVGLLLSAPVWVLVAIAVKVEDGGPVFYAEERIGRGQRGIRCWKFRVVRFECGPGRSRLPQAGDLPVTTVGRVLRATALDELPQLWNIFKGDMSFVGPRAPRPANRNRRSGE